MARPLDDALSDVRSAVLDETTLVRAVGAGRRRGEQPAWRRVELRYVELKSGLRLQITSYDEQQAHTRNVAPGAPRDEAVDELLAMPFGNWHVDTAEATLQMRVTKKGDALLHTKRHRGDAAPSADRGHDRAKARLLDPADPVLHAIGITDHEGRVKPSRNAKYRQVEEFLRLLASTVDSAMESGRPRHRPTTTRCAWSTSAAATPTSRSRPSPTCPGSRAAGRDGRRRRQPAGATAQRRPRGRPRAVDRG